MRLCYLDDENNWINLNHSDDGGFIEFCQSARTVKLKAGVLAFPIQSRPLNSRTNSSSTITVQPSPPAAHGKGIFANSPPLRKTGQLFQSFNPVDRMLAKKLESVEGATKVLEHAKEVRDNFERELPRAVILNSRSLSICGKCDLRVGHTRRNC